MQVQGPRTSKIHSFEWVPKVTWDTMCIYYRTLTSSFDDLALPILVFQALRLSKFLEPKAVHLEDLLYLSKYLSGCHYCKAGLL